MPDNKRIHRTLKTVQRVKTWQLVVLFILAAFIAATFLRLNNIGMVQRRSAVLSADQSGDIGATTERLYDLQRYVGAHMNTSLGQGIELQTLYTKAYQAALKSALTTTSTDSSAYQSIDHACASEFHSDTAYIQCVTERIRVLPTGPNTLSSASQPDLDAYRYNFVSPLWSPDFAGWSVVVCAVLLLLILVRIVGALVLRLMLRRHFQSL